MSSQSCPTCERRCRRCRRRNSTSFVRITAVAVQSRCPASQSLTNLKATMAPEMLRLLWSQIRKVGARFSEETSHTRQMTCKAAGSSPSVAHFKASSVVFFYWTFCSSPRRASILLLPGSLSDLLINDKFQFAKRSWVFARPSSAPHGIRDAPTSRRNARKRLPLWSL